MTSRGERAGAVLLAAGRSSRMGENKMLMRFGGKTVLEHSLLALRASRVNGIVIVVSDETWQCGSELCAKWGASLAMGGPRRQDSVLNGLQALAAIGQYDIAVIHDGARCLVDPEIINATIESAIEFGSGVAGIPATDSIKLIDRDTARNVERTNVWLAQTPQTFYLDEIIKAYIDAEAHGMQVTDDASVFERVGKVCMVMGSEDNVKITTKHDLKIVRPMMCGDRIGIGEDAHRLAEGRALVIGGVTIAHGKGLLGHSDADVLTHAVMDAVLGALGLGDIGLHFPPDNNKYKDACSIELLKRVRVIMEGEGYRIGNIDCVVAAQQPRLSPYYDKMRAALAETLGCAPERVSIKSTTTEGMGPVGREEGIEARAVAMLICV